jgi:hypothetical protein
MREFHGNRKKDISRDALMGDIVRTTRWARDECGLKVYLVDGLPTNDRFPVPDDWAAVIAVVQGGITHKQLKEQQGAKEHRDAVVAGAGAASVHMHLKSGVAYIGEGDDESYVVCDLRSEPVFYKDIGAEREAVPDDLTYRYLIYAPADASVLL